MLEAYLTIDDSPWGRTDELTDFLKEREIPALLFACGNDLEKNPDAIVRAIQKGFVIGNHSYAHQPAGDLGFDAWRDDFEKMEDLIDQAYKDAGVKRPGHYYRFPYIDRGDGVRVERAAASGEGDVITNGPEVQKIQDYLKNKDVSQPFTNMPPDYMFDAADSLFTFTSGDWMLTQRHKGKWEYQSVDDLKTRIDSDESLKNHNHRHVILMHDQPDIFEEACALIDYFVEKGFTFLAFDQNT